MQVAQSATNVRFFNVNGKVALHYMWETGAKLWDTYPHDVIDTVQFLTMWSRDQVVDWCYNFMRDFF